jgi:hypothetical protein
VVNIGQHIKRKIHRDRQQQPFPLKARRAFVVQAKEDLLPSAKAIAAHDDADASTDSARSLLAPYLMRLNRPSRRWDLFPS